MDAASGDSASGDSPSGDASVYELPPLWSGSAPELIETGQQALSLAIDGSDVYWQNPGGSVFACPLDGCSDAKPTLLSSLIGPGSGVLQTLAAGAGTELFLTDYGKQISSFAGADPAHEATTYRKSASGGFSSLATDATNAYFVETESTPDAGYRSTSTLYSCPLGRSCSSPRRLHVTTDASIAPLFVYDGEVYFESFEITYAIRAVSIHGGNARTVCTSNALSQVQSLYVAGGSVFFTAAYPSTPIYRCSASGGTDVSVYVNDLQPYALASDGDNLYWTNYVQGPGSVIVCPLGATCDAPQTVAWNQENPLAIVANSKSVYWANASSIYRADR